MTTPRSLMEAGGSGKPQARPSAELPLDRAIAWTPRDPSGDAPQAPPLDARGNHLFIFRDVIEGINRHVDDAESRPHFGFLFGHLFHCPRTETDYAVADTLVEAPAALDEHAVGACLFRAWEEIQSHPVVDTALLMGWYHSHNLLGVRLSEGDIDVNRRYFSAPWQFSIVVAPRGERMLGGLFRPRSARGAMGGSKGKGRGSGGFFRRLRGPTVGGPQPFYELLSWTPSEGLDTGASALRWANYYATREALQPAAAPDSPLTLAGRIAPRSEDRTGRRTSPPRPIEPGYPPGEISAAKRPRGRDGGSGSDEAGGRPADRPARGGDGAQDAPEGRDEILLPSDSPAGGPPKGRPTGAGAPPPSRGSPPAGGSLAEAAGRDGPELGRVPLPLNRAVLWKPRGDAGSGWTDPALDRAAYQFFIEREALADVNRHLAGGDRESRFGFLLGRVFRCPLSGRHYSVADLALPAREVLDEQASGAHLLRAWTDAQTRLGKDPGLLLGWYHSHYLLGLSLSQSDIDVNRRYFNAPWQSAIVIVPDLNRALGGVFRPSLDTVTPEGARPSAFYELLPEVPADPLAPVSSAVVWTNYEADRKVVITPAEAGAAVAAQPKAPPAMFGVREGRPGVPLVIPAEGNQTGLLPPRSRRIAWPVLALVVVAALAAVMLLLPDSRRPGGSRSTSGTASPATNSRTPAPDTPEYRQFLSDVEALGIAGDRYAERASDFDADRIPCPLLATGYVTADEAYVQVAASYRALDAAPNSQAAAAYERAGEEIAEVNAHFDASGCPRP